MNVTPELLEEITRQVLTALSAQAPAAEPAGLLVGAGEWVPAVPGRRWAEEGAYQGDISSYTMVVCRQVSSAQLCDMAFGRDSTPATCAVSKALLAGKPVYILEEGLPHRANQVTANPRYYAMLEGYVTQLTQFGVRVVSRLELERLLSGQPAPASAPMAVPAAAPAAAPEKTCAPTAEPEQSPVFCGVLTADEARKLAKTCGGTLRLGSGAILTPLAKDVLRENRIALLFEEETSC